MSKQSTELAWDISEWDADADLSESNIKYNMERQFLAQGFILPSSIVCNREQERKLKQLYSTLAPNLEGIEAINLGYGVMRLKVVVNDHYQRAVR
jgi:hypothetical protein